MYITVWNCVIRVSLLGACVFRVLQSEVNHGAEVVHLTGECNSMPRVCVCVVTMVWLYQSVFLYACKGKGVGA